MKKCNTYVSVILAALLLVTTVLCPVQSVQASGSVSDSVSSQTERTVQSLQEEAEPSGQQIAEELDGQLSDTLSEAKKVQRPDSKNGSSLEQNNPLYGEQQSGTRAKTYRAAEAKDAEDDSEEDDSLPVYGSVEEAGACIRQFMVNRETRTALMFVSTKKYKGDEVLSLWVDIFEEALAETGVPREGDYLRYQWDHRNGEVPYYYEGEADGTPCYIYKMVFSDFTYYSSAEQEKQVDAEVETVLNNLNVGGKSAYEKTEAVYHYLVSTVTYDHDNLKDDSYKLKYTAYAALLNKTAVCQGYAVALYRLLMELQVPCRVIGGTSGDEGHAWNIVRLGGLWYNADSTWDASNYTSEGTCVWFLLNDKNFENHTRDESYATEEFYTDYPMGTSDYGENSPKTSSISGRRVLLAETEFVYDGQAWEPQVTAPGLFEGLDYTVAYADNIHAGTARVILTGKGEYTGTVTRKFTIKPAALTGVSAKGWSGYYDGKKHGITVTVKAPKGCTVTYAAAAGKSYTKTSPSYTKPGTYTVYYKVSKPDYLTVSGSAKVIIRLKQPSVQVSNVSNGVRISWTKTAGASGYYLYQKTSKGWKKIKDITRGSTTTWTHEKRTNGTKYTYTVKAYYGKNYSTYHAGKAIYRLSTPGISYLKSTASRTFTVKWGKNTRSTGYQVQYAYGSDFKQAKTVSISKNSTTSRTVRSLTKGKTCYVRVRSYKKVGKTIFYSGWSSVKKVKVR